MDPTAGDANEDDVLRILDTFIVSPTVWNQLFFSPEWLNAIQAYYLFKNILAAFLFAKRHSHTSMLGLVFRKTLCAASKMQKCDSRVTIESSKGNQSQKQFLLKLMLCWTTSH